MGGQLSALSTLALGTLPPGTRATLDAVEKRKISSLQGIELLILRRQSCILAPSLTGLL